MWVIYDVIDRETHAYRIENNTEKYRLRAVHTPLRICLILFLLRKLLNSVLVKAVALSDTTTSGRPRDANNHRSNLIVTADVDVFIT